MSEPVKLKRFFLADLVFPALPIIGLGLAIGAHLTPQDPPVPFVGWAILWTVVAGFFLINFLLLHHRLTMGKELRYTARGMVVAWKDEKYAVKDTDFEAAVDAYVEKMKPTYKDVEYALKGCVVIFREPKWPLHIKKGKVMSYAAGLQDNNILYVGWNENLAATALAHEMTHRVFQVFEKDPPQDEAHALMAKLGIS